MLTRSKASVFMAYQFNSTELSRIDREYALSQAVASVNATLDAQGYSYRAEWQIIDLESVRSLGEQVLGKIRGSVVFIADITELNANVLLELGFALGLREGSGLFRVHMMAHESMELRDLPADLLGGFVARYSAESFGPVVARLIRDSVLQVTSLLRRSEADSAWNRIWNLEGAGAVDIICSEIPDEVRPAFASHRHPNFLRYAKFADLDSLVFVHELLASRFPGLPVKDYGASESIARHEKGILLGGAAWNSRVERLQDCLPLRFVDSLNEESDSLLVEVEGVRMLFETKFSATGVPDADYFLFVRLRPDHQSQLLLFCGGLTHGVLGGLKTLGHHHPGPDNAMFLTSVVSSMDEIIVVGCVDHRDGYVKVHDFSQTPPCLVLTRAPKEDGFRVTISGCECGIHRETG